MIATANEVLAKFEQLTLVEKKKVITIILKENLEVETPILSDDELVLSAEELFLELDRYEAENGES